MKKLLKKILWLFPWLGNIIYKKELRTIRNSRYFDEKYYYFLRPDVFASKKDAALHYLLYGWEEKVNPSEFFNTSEYLTAYSDVNFNPLLHYECFGKKENRNAGIKPFSTFLQDEIRNIRRQTAEIQLTVQEEILKRNNAKQVEELKRQLLDITNSLQSKLQEQQNAFESKLAKVQLEQKQSIEDLKKKSDWRDSDVRRQMNYLYYKGLHPEQYEDNLKEWYKSQLGENLNLDNPKTFNEKIQWLKLNDSTPLKTQLADKYLVREWVKNKIGEKYLIPLLGVWDDFNDINFNSLPRQFVLKANHGCAYNIIVKDKTTFNKDDARNKFKLWLRENFAFKFGLEMHYKNIQPKIIAENFIENTTSGDLYDYKFWCFNGKVHYIQFLSERNLDGLKMAFYDKDWNKQHFVYSCPLDKKTIEKPDNLDEMINLAEKLSKNFNHVRVDFYRLDDGTIYFGEMTFTSASGSCKWNDEKINQQFGDLIKLPIDKK